MFLAFLLFQSYKDFLTILQYFDPKLKEAKPETEVEADFSLCVFYIWELTCFYITRNIILLNWIIVCFYITRNIILLNWVIVDLCQTFSNFVNKQWDKIELYNIFNFLRSNNLVLIVVLFFQGLCKWLFFGSVLVKIGYILCCTLFGLYSQSDYAAKCQYALVDEYYLGIHWSMYFFNNFIYHLDPRIQEQYSWHKFHFKRYYL